MKHYRIFLTLTMLVLASLACQALAGGGEDAPAMTDEPVTSQTEEVTDATAEPVSTEDSSSDTSTTGDSDFPMTDDAYQVFEVGDGSVLYYTKMSLDDVMKFYRDEYTGMGYTEREILTTVTGGVFSMVFDGDPSGKAVVIQSVDLGDGSRTIAIRLEDI